jgi:phage terminase large subunit GpA-like protein
MIHRPQVLAQAIRKVWRVIRPPPILLVSEWAAEDRFLSPEASAEPGKWRNERAPHLVAPMDALSSQDPCRRVVCKFSSQTGKTEVTLNFLGYIITHDPGPVLVIQPNVKPMGEAYSKDRVAPLIRDCPAIRAQVVEGKGKNSANTISHKTFPGGHLTIGGGNSPAQLASRPIRYFVGDELDRWDVTKEGSPLLLARKRQTTFHNRKELLCSSPTFEDVGIDAEYKKCEQQYRWELSCPDCEKSQFPQLKHFQWDDDYRQAVYVCEHCGTAHPIGMEDRIKARGGWVKTRDAGWRTKGFWMNQFCSPFARWVDTIEEFVSAKGDKDALQVVTNTAFAETWHNKGEALTNAGLMDRREPISLADIPEAVTMLTAGVDVQKDRLECQTVGWDDRHRPLILAHEIFIGSPSKPEVWDALETYITTEYCGLTISTTCVDRGYLTEYVDAFCRPRWGRVHAVRGEAGANKMPISKPRIGGKPRSRYIPVGVDKYKDRLQATMRDLDDIRFSDTLTDEWFDQLMAEEVIIRKSKGHAIREWVKVKKRNEALDCLVYAWAAKDIRNPRLQKPRIETVDTPPVVTTRPPARKSWVNNYRL